MDEAEMSEYRAGSGRSKGAQGSFAPWGHVRIGFIKNGLCSFFAILSRTLGLEYKTKNQNHEK